MPSPLSTRSMSPCLIHRVQCHHHHRSSFHIHGFLPQNLFYQITLLIGRVLPHRLKGQGQGELQRRLPSSARYFPIGIEAKNGIALMVLVVATSSRLVILLHSPPFFFISSIGRLTVTKAIPITVIALLAISCIVIIDPASPMDEEGHEWDEITRHLLPITNRLEPPPPATTNFAITTSLSPSSKLRHPWIRGQKG